MNESLPKQELPLLKSARREVFGAMTIWLTATVYTVGYCTLNGYGRDPQTLTYVLGFPDWVFWGVVLPWGTCTVVASLIAFLFMKDEDLDGGTGLAPVPVQEE